MKEATEKNHAEAFYQLGLLYEFGKGMEHKDLEQARVYFRLPSVRGDDYKGNESFSSERRCNQVSEDSERGER